MAAERIAQMANGDFNKAMLEVEQNSNNEFNFNMFVQMMRNAFSKDIFKTFEWVDDMADPETEGITVIAMHPGWVRTEMGGEEAPLTAEESPAGILRVADKLWPEDNGKFLTWEGENYPW